MKGLFGSGLGAQPESQTAPKRNPGTPPSQLNSIASGGPHQYIPRLRGVYWGDIGVSQPARGYYINGWIQFKLPLGRQFPPANGWKGKLLIQSVGGKTEVCPGNIPGTALSV